MLKQLFLLGIMITGSLHQSLYCSGRTVEFSNQEEIAALFPHSPEDITRIAQEAQDTLKKDIATILAVKPKHRTYANLAYALDTAIHKFRQSSAVIKMLERVSPDESIRTQAHQIGTALTTFIDLDGSALIEEVLTNQKLYNAFKGYLKNRVHLEKLNAEQKRFLNELMTIWRRNGLHLNPQDQLKAKKLKQEITQLQADFEQNINTYQRSITVTREELEGVPQDFINTLEKTDDNRFVLKGDYPTIGKISEKCIIEDTRRKMYIAFHTRAYPENVVTLNNLLKKRHEFAQLLGFNTFADYDCAHQMAKSPKKVRTFFSDVASQLKQKYEAEFRAFTKDLPANVTLTAQGKIKPWDLNYIIAEYKKRHFSLDENQLAEYFPAEHTIAGLIGIYEQFMQIKMVQVPIHMWHPDVKVLQIFDRHSQLRGYIILDLFPRPNKYHHAASFVIAHSRIIGGKPTPAVNVVVANFPPPTNNKPALLTHYDVTTFFHELGHALHCMLGSTEHSLFSGYNTKTDFIEVPSQMLEEWVWDKHILKGLSHHYMTGQPLPDELLNNKIALRNCGITFTLMRQISLSALSLELYSNATDIDALNKKCHEEFHYEVAFAPETHFPCLWVHLALYASKYYSYLWAQVYAKDVLSEIKKYGLLNPEVGTRYVDTVLAKGGSLDPHQMLVAFLGREPNNKAFLEALVAG